MFNKYKWLEEQTESLTEYLQHDPEATYDDLHDYMMTDIDNACIYYADCFDIIKELHFTDFTDSDFTISKRKPSCLRCPVRVRHRQP
jgi:hypothetical protein